jgi:hypothetical protein
MHYVFELARDLASRFLRGWPVGVPDLKNKTDWWLKKLVAL